MTEVRGVRLLGEWRPREVSELKKMLDKIPEHLVEGNGKLKCIIRRKRLPGKHAAAPGHSMFIPDRGAIVVFDKGVYDGAKLDREQFRRSIYHEIAHSIIEDKRSLLKAWKRETRGDGFVDEYAKKSPDEDFAETFSEYLIFPKETRKAAPRKSAFLDTLLKEEKTAMSFLNGFTDEMTKQASLGALRRMMSGAQGAASQRARTPGQMSVGKGLLAAGGAGAGGLAVGGSKGRQKGIEEGTEGMEQGMEQAYNVGAQKGFQAGAHAMRNAIMRQMQKGQKGEGGGGAAAGGAP